MKKSRLKTGFTTGAAAAACVKGALHLIFSGNKKKKVRIFFLSKGYKDIKINICQLISSNMAMCTVIKDAGDDPDVTHKAEIGAYVTFFKQESEKNISIKGGVGVGKVTKPGLEIPPGEAAINLGPRKMICREINNCLKHFKCSGNVEVEIFIPKGEFLAKKTLNAKLGIIGGLSILGTTGEVKPLSHEAFITTIDSSLSVAKALGYNMVFLTTGRRSEKFAQKYWQEKLNEKPADEMFIQIGDFFAQSLKMAKDKKIRKIVLAIFFGKAIKMATGVECTHAAKSSLNCGILADWAKDFSQDRSFLDTIRASNTSRQAFYLIYEKCPKLIDEIGRKIIRIAKNFIGGLCSIDCVIFDYEGDVIFETIK